MVRDIYILYIFQVRDIYAPAQMEGWPQQPGNPGEIYLYFGIFVFSGFGTECDECHTLLW